jgi:hypothetical protein
MLHIGDGVKYSFLIMLGAAEIDRLRTVYNKEHPHERPIGKGASNTTWAEIRKRLHAKCTTGTPSCIVSAMMKRPKAPESWGKKRTEWLSSDDIDKVEKQYQILFEDYHFVGCVPIDFGKKSEFGECIVSALCSLKLTALANKGKHRIGIVFNTDTSDGPGQHWIAAFCDIRPELEYPRMTYFDSYAHTPEPEIQELMKRWKQQWDATGMHKQPMELSYNRVRHQRKDSECGMYCLYFHYACLLDISMDKTIPDDEMNAFRDLLFDMPEK